MKYHFKCPVCDFDDKEARYLLDENETICPLCDQDNNHPVTLERWPAEEEA